MTSVVLNLETPAVGVIVYSRTDEPDLETASVGDTVTVDPTTAEVKMLWVERTSNGVRRRWTDVPASGTVNYLDLVDVDPDTLNPTTPVIPAYQALLDAKAPIASPTFTGTVSGVTKTHVGLGNVDNVQQQPIAAALTQIASLDPADSQAVVYNGTLGEYVAENIPGGIRVGSNRNVTNTPTGMTAASGVGGGFGTIVTIPSTAISVEDTSGRPGVIKFGAALSQTAVGVCVTQLYVYETTVGNTGYKATVANWLPGIAIPFQVGYEWDGLGVVTTTRTFELRSRLYTSSAAMSAQWANTEAEPTFIRAVTE